jgi:hypothetical protein
MPCHLNGVLLAINFVMRNQFDELYSRPIHLMTELQCLPLAALDLVRILRADKRVQTPDSSVIVGP